MIQYTNNEALCFDDILLVPQTSDVKSRRAVELRMSLDKNGVLDLPVISSPMDTITESDMAVAMAEAGGLGIIHRYMSAVRQSVEVAKAAWGGLAVGAAVSASDDFMSRAERCVAAGACVILVDTANGHNDMAVDAVRALRDRFDNVHIMAGNVSTKHGYYALSNAGADSVRVGIGGGSCCTTRLVSGHGMPTLASIMECARERDNWASMKLPAAKIIADGGIRNTGDMVKAFAAGADAVMIGSMLAGTDETPGEVSNGRKQFRGMASASAQVDWRGRVSAVAEGVETTVASRGPVGSILNDIRTGLGSGCSYSGVNRLADLQDAAMYVRVSAASLSETRPHIKERDG